MIPASVVLFFEAPLRTGPRILNMFKTAVDRPENPAYSTRVERVQFLQRR